jgi:hypothetical protein
VTAKKIDVSRETTDGDVSRETSSLSAGEVDDLINAGVTRSPFTGETLCALDFGIVPGNADAAARAAAYVAEREDA